MGNILILEDDKAINKGIKFNLELDKNKVYSAFSIKEAREIFKTTSLDFMILDINLPDGLGLDFCKEVRESSNVPILFLTACDLEVDQLMAFEFGADDYITKPFSISILKQRINAIMKRYSRSNIYTLKKSGEFELDTEKLTLKKGENQIILAPTEYKVMKLFIENMGKVLTREFILEKLWDDDKEFVEEHTLTVNINRLRGKIEENPKKPKYIKTVYGMGYIWQGGKND
ncbi:MAG: response regulator transcription factor [Sarcina sp.]